MRPLLAQAFDQRRDSLYARLDRLGRVELEDLGADREVRRLFADLADLAAPGQDLGWPDEARFQYQEWWRRSAPGWVRVRYDDDDAGLLNGGRRSCRPNASPNRSRIAAPCWRGLPGQQRWPNPSRIAAS